MKYFKLKVIVLFHLMIIISILVIYNSALVSEMRKSYDYITLYFVSSGERNYCQATRIIRGEAGDLAITHTSQKDFDDFFDNEYFIIDNWSELSNGITFKIDSDLDLVRVEMKRVNNSVLLNIVGPESVELYQKVMEFARNNLVDILDAYDIKFRVLAVRTSHNELMEDNFSILNLTSKELETVIYDIEEDGDGTGYTQFSEDFKEFLDKLSNYIKMEVTIFKPSEESQQILDAIYRSKGKFIQVLDRLCSEYEDKLAQVKAGEEYVIINFIARPIQDVRDEIEYLAEMVSFLEADLGTLIHRAFYLHYIKPYTHITQEGQIYWLTNSN